MKSLIKFTEKQRMIWHAWHQTMSLNWVLDAEEAREVTFGLFWGVKKQSMFASSLRIIVLRRVESISSSCCITYNVFKLSWEGRICRMWSAQLAEQVAPAACTWTSQSQPVLAQALLASLVQAQITSQSSRHSPQLSRPAQLAQMLCLTIALHKTAASQKCEACKAQASVTVVAIFSSIELGQLKLNWVFKRESQH